LDELSAATDSLGSWRTLAGLYGDRSSRNGVNGMLGSVYRNQLVGSVLFIAASVATATTGVQAETLLVHTQGNVLVNTGDGF